VLRGAAGLAAGSAAFLLACGGDSKDEAKATTAPSSGTAAPAAAAGTPTPKRGGRLGRFFSNNSPNLNPLTNFPEGSILSGVHVYDRLISTKPPKDYVLEAAQSLEQPDATTIIFKLKPGLKYQDRAPVSGRAVTTEDILKWQQVVKDTPGAANSFQTASLQSAEAPDAQTVVFKLKAPNAWVFSLSQLCSAAGQAIVPKELHDNLDTNWPVGSGPYQLAEYQLDVRYLYKRFDGYREASKGLPYVDEHLVFILKDPAAHDAAFRSQQIDLWESAGPTPSAAETLRKDLGSKIEIHEWPTLNAVTFSANATKPPFNDVRVREAFYRFINRQQIVELVESGKGSVPPGPLPTGQAEYQLTAAQTDKYFKQDAKAAKQLLEAAGFDFNKEIEMTTANQPPRNTQGMEVIQQQAVQAGVKLRLVPLPATEWLNQRLLPGNWETWYAFHPAWDTPQTALRLHHTNTLSLHRFNGLKDPAVDAMIDKSEVTVDKNERIKLVKEIQLALLEKYTPMILTHTPTGYLPRWNHVRDFELNIGNAGPLYQTQIWLDK
jgi:peptide/nickel transport system substrate-binding protein